MVKNIVICFFILEKYSVLFFKKAVKNHGFFLFYSLITLVLL